MHSVGTPLFWHLSTLRDRPWMECRGIGVAANLGRRQYQNCTAGPRGCEPWSKKQHQRAGRDELADKAMQVPTQGLKTINVSAAQHAKEWKHSAVREDRCEGRGAPT